MIWAGGRLLLHLLRAVRALLGVAFWSVLARAEAYVRGNGSLTKRLAIAALAVAILGPGRPILTKIAPDLGGQQPSAVGEAGSSGGGFSMWPFDGDATPVGPSKGSSKGSEQAPPAPPSHKRTALIVGINNARGGRSLPGSITDATNLRDALLAYGFPRSNITVLLEEKATRGAIRNELDSLAARTPSDGVAVFAVATHTRRRGGVNELLTADGARITATELAARLGKVHAPMWVALPTCYSAGYAKPGIVGHNRVATFASPEDQPTYQLGNAGSYLIINMVRKAMLEGRAPDSVEDAFRYARTTLERDVPNRVPIISDGYKGELVLGEMSQAAISSRRQAEEIIEDSPQDSPKDSRNGSAWRQGGDEPVEPPESQEPEVEDAAEEPEPTPGSRDDGLGVCGGRFSYSCSYD